MVLSQASAGKTRDHECEAIVRARGESKGVGTRTHADRQAGVTALKHKRPSCSNSWFHHSGSTATFIQNSARPEDFLRFLISLPQSWRVPNKLALFYISRH